MGFTHNPIISGINQFASVNGVKYNITKVGGQFTPSFSLYFLGDSLPNGVSFSRDTHATMLDSQGRLVWAPANLVSQSSTTGAAVGVVGSGGAFPTNWARSAAAGITHEILSFDSDYVVFRVYGTNGTGGAIYPQITFLNTPVTVLPTEEYHGSAEVQLVAGSLSGLSAAIGKINTQHLNSGSYVNECTPSAQMTSTLSRLSSYIKPIVAGANQVRISLNLTLTVGQSIDLTIKVGKPQLERLGADSPKQYTQTTSTAYHGPRFEYHPQALTPLGILVETSRTNLQPISQGATTDWTGVFSTVSTTGALILGNSAYTFTTTSTSGRYTYITTTPTTLSASTVYTTSVRVKKGTHSRAQLSVSNNVFLPTVADAYLNYNFDTDTLFVGGSALPAPTATRVLYADGTVLISLTYTAGTAPVAGAGAIINLVDSNTAGRLAGTTTNGATVHMYGVQVEQGAFSTSYIPTYGVSVVRNADNVTCTTGWYNETEGTLVVEGEIPPTPAATFVLFGGISNGSVLDNEIQVGLLGGRTSFVRVDSGGSVVVNSNPLGSAPSGPARVGITYKSGDYSFVLNGGTVSTVTPAGVPIGSNMTVLRLGGVTSTVANARWISRVLYYPTKLSNTQLQLVTAVAG